METSFSRTVDLLHRALDAQTVRRDIIANNIANSGVPNFKRSELTFESELKRALDREGQRPVLELTQTDPRHISNVPESDYQKVRPRRVLDYTSTSNNNGNNVDPEQEFMRALENQLMYNLLAQSESFEFNQVNLVLRQ
ncbi:flagellar basal body rod protein FlgB [Spirochaetia bacterium]|nr:flagellar basal body rod protein FlgB [Spirochaetia bacterium]GHU33742.1 flagellar basal body rod protein FlgB [Spirochaetia bacterium]